MSASMVIQWHTMHKCKYMYDYMCNISLVQLEMHIPKVAATLVSSCFSEFQFTYMHAILSTF